jgi:hypothetical protein
VIRNIKNLAEAVPVDGQYTGQGDAPLGHDSSSDAMSSGGAR